MLKRRREKSTARKKNPEEAMAAKETEPMRKNLKVGMRRDCNVRSFNERVQRTEASEISDWYRQGTARRGGKLRHSQRFIIIKRGRSADTTSSRRDDARNYQKREMARVTSWLGRGRCSTGWKADSGGEANKTNTAETA